MLICGKRRLSILLAKVAGHCFFGNLLVCWAAHVQAASCINTEDPSQKLWRKAGQTGRTLADTRCFDTSEEKQSGDIFPFVSRSGRLSFCQLSSDSAWERLHPTTAKTRWCSSGARQQPNLTNQTTNTTTELPK